MWKERICACVHTVTLLAEEIGYCDMWWDPFNPACLFFFTFQVTKWPEITKWHKIIWTGNRHFMKVTWFHETDCAPSLAYKIVQALNSFMASREISFICEKVVSLLFLDFYATQYRFHFKHDFSQWTLLAPKIYSKNTLDLLSQCKLNRNQYLSP